MKHPANHGLSRFRLDCNFFDDERIMAIAGEFGSTGELVALRLLTMIYRNGYRLRWDDMLRMRLMRCVDGVTVEILDRIVARLAEYGFFDADTFRRSSVLTSREIQQQYAAATRRRRTAPDHRPFWILDTPTSHEPAQVIADNDTTPAPAPPNDRKNDFVEETIAAQPPGRLAATLDELGIDLETFRALARAEYKLWMVTGKRHRDRADAATHLLSAVGIRARRGEGRDVANRRLP